jgi:hypothetical protein
MRSRHHHRIVSLLLTASPSLLLVGCVTPAPLVRLAPLGPNVAWVSGRAAVEKEETGVRVAAAFDQQDGNMLGLRVEVENLSEEKLEVTPTDFSYVVCTDEGNASCGAARRVVDPEGVLTTLDTQQSREHAAAVNDQAAMVPFLILGMIGDVGSIASGKGDPHSTETTAGIMEHDAARHDRSLMSISSQRQLWSNAAFRRTTLFPGKGAAGQVFIPIEPTARYIWVTIRAGGRRFPFCFHQTMTIVRAGE